MWGVSIYLLPVAGRRRLFPLLCRRRPFPCKNSNYLLTSRKISAILLLQRSGRLCECRFLYDVDTPLIMCFHRPSKTLILPVTSGSLPFAAVVFYPPYGSRFLFLTKSARCDILLIGFKLSIHSLIFTFFKRRPYFRGRSFTIKARLLKYP